MVRPLSQQLQEIAIEELHEDLDRVGDDIKHIQDWIRQQSYLNAPTDEQWILGFLRGCKFSLQTTKEKIDMYYTTKTLIPELLKPRDVYSSEIQALLKAGIVLPLPYIKDYQGPRVILIRYHNCDTSIFNVINISAFFFMITTILMNEDDNFIVSGVTLWIDMTYYPLSLLLQFTPTLTRNLFYSVQNSFPIRIKGIHVTGSHILGEKLFSLLRGYMMPKLKDRLFIYSDKKFENFFKSVPKKCLPKEYGGDNSTIEEIGEYWSRKVESYSSWFVENDQYGTNEAMRPEKPASFGDVIGIDGSFRRLNID